MASPPPARAERESRTVWDAGGMTDLKRSLLGPSLRIVGEIKCADELEVHCVVDGPIEAGSVVVGADGTVRGMIHADRLVVHGTVVGGFMGKEFEIGETGRIVGDVVCDSISMAKNALLKGRVIVNDPADADALVLETPVRGSAGLDGRRRSRVQPLFGPRRRASKADGAPEADKPNPAAPAADRTEDVDG